MLILQLLGDGLIGGFTVGLVAISFSLVYSTTKIFHIAHAGIYTLGGYLAWYLAAQNVPFVVACLIAIAGAAATGALIQGQIYERLERSNASPLVMLIASLGLLAILTNAVALIFSPNFLQFENSWRTRLVSFGGIHLTYVQIAIAITCIVVFAGLLALTRWTPLGRRIRAVSSNPFLAEIARLRPQRVAIHVMVIASAIAATAGILVGVDQAMQPYTGVLVLLTATIAMIAGGIGSLTGAFVISLVLSVMQSVALVVMPGRWTIAATFGVFILFILLKPEGLFRKR